MSRPHPPLPDRPKSSTGGRSYRRKSQRRSFASSRSTRNPAAEFTQPPQKFLGRRSPLDLKHASSGDMNLYIVPFFQPERLDDGLGQADGEAVSPFGDVHDVHSDIRQV